MTSPSKKDHLRVHRLIDYAETHGIEAGKLKAQRDAELIEDMGKLEARYTLLMREEYPELAAYFRARGEWLDAQGGACS